MPIETYKQLHAWQEAITLCDIIHDITKEFTRSDLMTYGSQIRRASISIPSNIAEGYGRVSKKEFQRFLRISLGSAYELETQILISKRAGLISDTHYQCFQKQIGSVIRLLVAFCKSLNN